MISGRTNTESGKTLYNNNTAMSKVSGGKLYNKQGNYRGIELWQH